MRFYIYFLSFSVIFCSCDFHYVNKNKNNLGNTICSMHFCFHINDGEVDDLKMKIAPEIKKFIDISEEMFSYVAINYNFADVIKNYPYRITVFSSTYPYLCDECVRYSELECDFKRKVILLIADDLFGYYKNFHKWLYYGFVYHILRRSCADIEYRMQRLFEAKKLDIKLIMNINPDFLSDVERDIYYANVSEFIGYMIKTYSANIFSDFIKKFLSHGDYSMAMYDVFNEDVVERYRRSM